MSARNDGGTSWPVATAVLAESWSGSMVCTMVDRFGASARTAKACRLRAHLFRMFAILPAVGRYALLSLVILVAVTGHLAMAWLLPSAVRPTPILSAAVLFAGCLTAIAASARRR